MIPKEKAIELVEKYDETLTYLESKSKAKQCALIAVDEILLNIEATILYHKESLALPINKEYWHEVKQEIEKL